MQNSPVVFQLKFGVDTGFCALNSRPDAKQKPLSGNLSPIMRTIIELGGPEALSPLELVNIFETTKEKKFELQFVPEEAITAQRDGAQDRLTESFAALTLGVVKGSEIDMKNTLDIFPMDLTSVNDFVSRLVVI